jgi:Na+/glutamate symporter
VIDPSTAVGAVTKAVGKVPQWLGKAIKAWLRWFWHLGAVPKIVVTVVEVIVLYVVCDRLPIAEASRRAITGLGGVGLFFLLIVALLFGRTAR